MNIIIRGKRVEVTDALREYVMKRVGKLAKYSDDFTDVQVTLLVEKDRHRVEVTAPSNGMIVRGEEETSDMYSSIDLVIEKLERQIEKYRTRILKRNRKAAKDQDVGNGAAAEVLEEESKIVRRKKFQVKPMSVDEAVMQMNLVGHSFFVFLNEDTHQINVVYRRHDGNYGLLEPEI